MQLNASQTEPRPTRLGVRTREVAREQVRSARAWRRVLSPGPLPHPPEFLIIGGMRCGTTSLFRCLAAHPQIDPPLGKELNFFTRHHGKGLRWYRAHFPARGPGQLSFEASPYYMFHPSAPARVARAMPDVKLVVLLRNPADRAYSHYLHTRRRGFEPLSFADALDAENARLDSPRAGSGMARDPMRLYSYTRRGLYADQLERWLEHFPAEQLHVMRSKHLFDEPAAALARLSEFLGVTPIQAPLGRYASTSPQRDSQLTSDLRHRLEDRFAEPNARLADLLGWSPTWAGQDRPQRMLERNRAPGS